MHRSQKRRQKTVAIHDDAEQKNDARKGRKNEIQPEPSPPDASQGNQRLISEFQNQNVVSEITGTTFFFVRGNDRIRERWK